MAVLWQTRKQGVHYQVRQAGNSLRLYTDGVFHSQFNSRCPLGGNIWDLLVLPSFYLSASPRRVLVLGVGGGAVIRQLNALPFADAASACPEAIVGVELDAQHIQIARRFFQLQHCANTQLIHGNAVTWLQAYDGEAFDLIIDDLFSGGTDGPQRAVVADAAWCRLLAKHTRRQGVVVMNFESAKALRQCGFIQNEKLRQGYADKLSLRVAGYDNRIGAFFKGARRHMPQRQQRYRQRLQVAGSLARRLNAKSRVLDR